MARQEAASARDALVVGATGNPDPAGVLALQRRIGNRATVALLSAATGVQRDPPDEQPGPSAGAARGRAAIRGLVKESREFNKEPRKKSNPFKMDVRAAAMLGPERASKFRELTEAHNERQKLTTTAGGAYIASQMNQKAKIGSAAAYTTPEQSAAHLSDFADGAHAFVTNDAYLRIRGEHGSLLNFNAWGAGSNFVAPLADADQLVARAAAEGGEGLFALEQALGIPSGSWVAQSEKAGYAIWRFKVLKPQALHLRLPSGNESGAYATWTDQAGAHRGEWRPGGQTVGGAKEAVIDQVGAGRFGEKGDAAGLKTRTELAELEKAGIIKIELDSSMSANTKRVMAERAKPA